MKNYSHLAISGILFCGIFLWGQGLSHTQNKVEIWIMALTFWMFLGSLGYLWVKNKSHFCSGKTNPEKDSVLPGSSFHVQMDADFKNADSKNMDDVLGIQESSAFHVQLGNELSEQLSSAHTELGNTQAILNDAIAKLVSNFIAISDGVRELSEHTNGFSRQLHDLADHMGTGSTMSNEVDLKPVDLSGERSTIGKIMEDLYRFKEVVTKNAVDLNMISTNVEQNVLVVISTLQFQDMSSQLIEHARLRMNALQKVADEMSKVSSNTTQPTRGEYLKRIAEYNRLLDKYVTSLNHQKANPVSQRNFGTGDIELF